MYIQQLLTELKKDLGSIPSKINVRQLRERMQVGLLGCKGNRLQGSLILQKSVEIVRKLKAKNDQLKGARPKLYFSVVRQFLSCHIDFWYSASLETDH
uniref:Uncharacterized protein n=1 Tax=Glossina pallidipes TaxID=7398 RepID=A0A1A9Z2W4_GLOPL